MYITKPSCPEQAEVIHKIGLILKSIETARQQHADLEELYNELDQALSLYAKLRIHALCSASSY